MSRATRRDRRRRRRTMHRRRRLRGRAAAGGASASHLRVASACWSRRSVLAVVSTQTSWFKDWLRRYIARQATTVLDGELSIGRLRGNLFSGSRARRRHARAARRARHRHRPGAGSTTASSTSSRAASSSTSSTCSTRCIVARQTAAGLERRAPDQAAAAKPGGGGPSITITSIRVSDGQVLVHRLPPRRARRHAGARAGAASTISTRISLAPIPGSLAARHRARVLRHGGPGAAPRAFRRPNRAAAPTRWRFERLRVDLPAQQPRVDGAITGDRSTARRRSRGHVHQPGVPRGRLVPSRRATIPLQPCVHRAAARPVRRARDRTAPRVERRRRADGHVLVDFADGRAAFCRRRWIWRASTRRRGRWHRRSPGRRPGVRPSTCALADCAATGRSTGTSISPDPRPAPPATPRVTSTCGAGSMGRA